MTDHTEEQLSEALAEISALKRQRDDLFASNNSLLERARTAEAVLGQIRGQYNADGLDPVAKLIDAALSQESPKT